MTKIMEVVIVVGAWCATGWIFSDFVSLLRARGWSNLYMPEIGAMLVFFAFLVTLGFTVKTVIEWSGR